MTRESQSSGDPYPPEGRYANVFKVGHNAFEFVIEFGQFYPEGDRERLHTRIITTPRYVKLLAETLDQSISRYEQTFGPIQEE
jgi:hypothetical protein